MQYIITILAIYSLAHLIRNISGPFNIIGLIRNKLMNNYYVGVFFYKLLSCGYCTGFNCGYMVYMLQYNDFNIRNLIIWGLVGAISVYMFDALTERFF